MSGLFLDQSLDASARGIALRVFGKMQQNAGAAAWGHRAGFADHESRIEADAEPSDQRLSLGALPVLPGFDAVQKSFGAGARNRAERLDQLIALHPDAVVFAGKLPPGRIERDDNARLGIVAEKRRRGDRFVA